MQKIIIKNEHDLVGLSLLGLNENKENLTFKINSNDMESNITIKDKDTILLKNGNKVIITDLNGLDKEVLVELVTFRWVDCPNSNSYKCPNEKNLECPNGNAIFRVGIISFIQCINNCDDINIETITSDLERYFEKEYTHEDAYNIYELLKDKVQSITYDCTCAF